MMRVRYLLINLNEGLESIGSSAFSYCPKLEKITIPSTVTQIGVGAFSYSGIKKIEIPKGVRNIFCDKDEILLPEEKGLFLGCKNLKKVVIKSKKITKVAKNSFYKTNKKVKIYVPKGKKKKYTKLFRKKGKLSKKVKILAIK